MQTHFGATGEQGMEGPGHGQVAFFPPCLFEGATQLHKISVASRSGSGRGGGGRMVVGKERIASPTLCPASGAAGLRCLLLCIILVYNLCFGSERRRWVVTRTRHSPVHSDTRYVPAQQGVQGETRSMQLVWRKGLLYGNKLDADKMIKHRLNVDKFVCR